MNTLLLRYKRNTFLSIAPYSIFTGLAVGVVVSVYNLFIEFAAELSGGMYAWAKGSAVGTAALFLILLVAAGFCSLLVRMSNVSRGSGVPQALGVLRGAFVMNWLKGCVVMFVCSVVATVMGLSLGSEGPSMLIGGLTAAAVAKTCPMYARNYLVTGGVGGGLAVAFNAPLSGAFIVMEEGHRRFSPLIAASAILMVATATVTAAAILGNRIVLPLLTFDWQWIYIPFLAITGVAVFIFSLLFNVTLLAVKKLLRKLRFGDKIDLRFFLPFILAGVTGLFLLPATGGGAKLINMLIKEDFAFKMLAALLAAKMLLTIFSTGAGVPGGIFVPMLALGAIVGTICGKAFGYIAPSVSTQLFTVCAMVAFFTGVSHSFVTALVLSAELTGNPLVILPALIVVGTVKLLTKVFRTHGLYETLLKQTIEDNCKGGYNESETFTLSVQKYSVADGRTLGDLILPDGVSAVGADGVILRANTQLKEYDSLTFEMRTLDNVYAKNVLLSLFTSRNKFDELDGISPDSLL